VRLLVERVAAGWDRRGEALVTAGVDVCEAVLAAMDEPGMWKKGEPWRPTAPHVRLLGPDTRSPQHTLLDYFLPLVTRGVVRTKLPQLIQRATNTGNAELIEKLGQLNLLGVGHEALLDACTARRCALEAASS
jgi:hypothetical protein